LLGFGEELLHARERGQASRVAGQIAVDADGVSRKPAAVVGLNVLARHRQTTQGGHDVARPPACRARAGTFFSVSMRA